MARQRGSITKKGGQYYLVLNIPDSGGKRKRKWIPAGSDRRVAMQRLTAELSALDNGTFVNSGRETLGQFLSQWIKAVEGTISPRTREGYETIINRIVPAIGGILLRKISPSDIQVYFSSLLGESGRLDGKGGLTPLTVIHHHRLLHRAFRDAVSWGLIGRNPCDLVKAPKDKGNSIEIMNENEARTFLNVASEGDYGALFHTFLFTGARRSELLAVRWNNFDPLLCTLSITRSLHHLRTGEYVIQSTKTAASKRVIDLTPSTVKVLQDHRQQVMLQRIKLGIILKETDLIFSNYNGSPLRPDTISRAWSILAKKLGIAAYKLHSARHFHASILLKGGVPPHVVQQRLGHSTIMTTMDIYGHVMKGMGAVAAQIFDEALRVRDNKINV